MPDLSRIFIKTSLAYLAAALLIGIVLTPPFLAQSPQLAALYPAYIHLLVVGWLTQLIFGVAFWLFPRYSRDAPFGNVRVPWLSFVLLNVGLILRLISEPPRVWHPAALWDWGLGLAALLQWLAGILFVAHIWRRVRTK